MLAFREIFPRHRAVGRFGSSLRFRLSLGIVADGTNFIMNLRFRFFIPGFPVVPVFLLLGSIAFAQPMAIKDVRTWMMQTSKLESSRAIKALAASNYDLLVIDDLST